ncbi:MAG: endolytic transglycosylase MltG, partial [Burkholderiaceae bacterium]
MFRLIKRCLVLGLFVVLLSAGTVVWWVAQPLPMTLLKGATAIDLQVKPNATPLSVAKDLSASGVTVPGWVLFEWFRWSGEATQIKAGSYEIAPGLTPRGLLDMLTAGKQATRRVTIVEGWTFAQMRQALASAPTLRRDTDSLSDAELMTRIGRPGVHPEGRFFPDTYVYPKNGSDV